MLATSSPSSSSSSLYLLKHTGQHLPGTTCGFSQLGLGQATRRQLTWPRWLWALRVERFSEPVVAPRRSLGVGRSCINCLRLSDGTGAGRARRTVTRERSSAERA